MILKLCYSSGNSLYSGHQPQTLRIMKHKSLTGRALPILTITLLLITHACSIEDRPEIKTPESNPHNVTVEEALSNLNSALELINGGDTKATIGGKVSRVNLITAADFPSTKAIDGQDEFEQLLYIVDFEDNQGYAVLGADDRFVPVLVITEQGSSPTNIVDPPSVNPGGTSPDGLTLEQLYCEADGDYYLGGSSPSTMTSTLIRDYVIKTMSGGVLPPGADDGSYPPGHEEDPTNPGNPLPQTGLMHALLKTCWHQDSPFNNYVTVKTKNGETCPIGCTTTAAIQILTRNKDISLSSKFGISGIQWSTLENCRFGNTSDEKTKAALSTLGKSAADGIGVHYNFLSSDSTFATPAAVARYFKSLGYSKTKRHIGYNLKTITDMLEDSKPVFIGALASNFHGHAWVIDGYRQKRNNSGKVITYLHCNWGWTDKDSKGNIYYGVLNGYYESKLFDTTEGPEIFDDKDPQISASSDLSGWWWYRIITY